MLWTLIAGCKSIYFKTISSNVVCTVYTVHMCLYVQITNDKKLYFMVLFKHICVNKFSIPEIHSNQTEILIHVYTRTIFVIFICPVSLPLYLSISIWSFVSHLFPSPFHFQLCVRVCRLSLENDFTWTDNVCEYGKPLYSHDTHFGMEKK